MKLRYQYILKIFDDLKVGEFIKHSNDHDPKPLYYLLLMVREDMFIWEYLEEGSDLWCVAIGRKLISNEILSDIYNQDLIS